ncbi:hypothetical protein CKO12_12560 [Chromatium okenii]|uniref:PDDEXK-like family protein n=1 Tax=Chromatium okenii TaxID=61644 RepID=UPI0019089E96|nr:PD-(D/E)XK nuclease family protein [Chromatium okenii]MBK1642687.1 hypothetical protein [Chromatium okenii]
MTKTNDLETFQNCVEFNALCSYSHQFDLFKVMGVRGKEFVYSNILASLLNKKEPHGLGDSFINAVMEHLRTVDPCNGTRIQCAVFQSAFGKDAKISRELNYIDIVIDFPSIKLVIAIENKIWAGEQPAQIKRYQETLKKKYPTYNQCLIFLTPSGRNPDTIDNTSSVPVYCVSYTVIIDLLKNCLLCSTVDRKSDASVFIKQFIKHLEVFVCGGNSEIQELCYKIFSENEAAYKYIVNSYTHCVSRKIEDLFFQSPSACSQGAVTNPTVTNKIISIEERAKQEGFQVIDKKCECVPKTPDIVRCSIDLKCPEWPDGLGIKIYKYGWFGVFPYVKKGSTFFNSDLKSVDWVKGEEDLYYALPINKHEDRCILDPGNDIGEEHIEEAITRAKEYAEEINKILGAMSCSVSPVITASITDDLIVAAESVNI